MLNNMKIRAKKITIEKLAQMTTYEFRKVHKKLDNTATKDDLKRFATKDDLHEMREVIIEDVRRENRKVLLSNDKLVTKLDIIIKESAAHSLAHARIDDSLLDHESRIKKVEKELVK